MADLTDDTYIRDFYKFQIDSEELDQSCAGDGNDRFIDMITLFNREQIAQLLSILNNQLYKETRVLEVSDPDASVTGSGLNQQMPEDVANTPLDAPYTADEISKVSQNIVDNVLDPLSTFTGAFQPKNWINPLGLQTDSTGEVMGRQNQLMEALSSGNAQQQPFVTVKSYMDFVGTDNNRGSDRLIFKGLTVRGLFAGALAFNIDPYDANPSLNIPPHNKSQWLAITSEIVNMVLMLVTFDYYIKNVTGNLSGAALAAGNLGASQAEQVRNYKAMNTTINTRLSLSDMFHSYMNSGVFLNISTVDPLDPNNPLNPYNQCRLFKYEGEAITTYEAFVAYFENITPDLGNIGPDASLEEDAAENRRNIEANADVFEKCGQLIIAQGLDKLKQLDNSYGVDLTGTELASEEYASIFLTDPTSYDKETHILSHPVYYLFVFNLIKLITDLEMQLGTSPYYNIADALQAVTTGNREISQQVAAEVEQAFEDSTCGALGSSILDSNRLLEETGAITSDVGSGFSDYTIPPVPNV